MSDAYRKLEEDNQNTIDDLLPDNKVDDETGEKEYSVEELRSSIYKQINLSCDWIENNYGVPSTWKSESKTFEEGQKTVVDATADDVYSDFETADSYCVTGAKQNFKYFTQFQHEDISKCMRASAWYQQNFFNSMSYMNQTFTNYENWYKLGHPKIKTIYSINIEQYLQEYNGNYCAIKAKITTNDGEYICYANLIMKSTLTDNKFVIYDITKE